MDSERGPSGPWMALAVVRFAAELGMLAGLAYAGWQLAGGSLAIGLVSAAAPVVLAVMAWGRWVAPRASRRLKDPQRLMVEVLLFTPAVLGLLAVDATAAAVALALGYLVSAPAGRQGY